MSFQTKQRKSNVSNEEGFAMFVLVLFFLAFFTTVTFGFLNSLTFEIKNTRQYTEARQAFYTAEAGVEDALYRLSSPTIDENSPIIFHIASSTATTTITDVNFFEKTIASEGALSEIVQNISVTAKATSTVKFSYAANIGLGGLEMDDTVNLTVDNAPIYSNGPVVGEGGFFYVTDIYGDLVVATTSPVDTVQVSGDVYAHTIQGSYSTVGGTAHASVLDEVTVYGDGYYEMKIGGADVYGTETVEPYVPKPLAPLPISDEDIEVIKDEASSGGAYTGDGCPVDPPTHTECTLIIFCDEVTDPLVIGPNEIPCDLNMPDDSKLVLNGPVWVDGDITFGSNVEVEANFDTYPGTIMPLVADDESAPLTGGQIVFEGGFSTGLVNAVCGLLEILLGIDCSDTDSFSILFISMNESAESGGGVPALQALGSLDGDLILYTPHGSIVLQDDVTVDQISAYKLEILQSSDINYSADLQTPLIPGIPMQWRIGAWQEVE